MKDKYFIRANGARYADKRYHVMPFGGGGSIKDFATRQEAADYIPTLLERDARDAEYQAQRAAAIVAEEQRRGLLTEDERIREDKERELKTELYILGSEHDRFVGSIESVAEGLEYVAKQIRQYLEHYKSNVSIETGLYPETLTSRLMEQMFFLPQHARPEYAVRGAFSVIQRQNVVTQLRRELGITAEQE